MKIDTETCGIELGVRKYIFISKDSSAGESAVASKSSVGNAGTHISKKEVRCCLGKEIKYVKTRANI